MNKLSVSILTLAVLIAASCSKSDNQQTPPPPPPPPTDTATTINVRGVIKTDQHWVKTKTYVLRGYIYVTDGAKLTMTDKEGKNEHTHVVPADAKITFDGKAATLADLKPGSKVKVVIEKKDDKIMIVSVAGSKGD